LPNRKFNYRLDFTWFYQRSQYSHLYTGKRNNGIHYLCLFCYSRWFAFLRYCYLVNFLQKSNGKSITNINRRVSGIISLPKLSSNYQFIRIAGKQYFYCSIYH